MKRVVKAMLILCCSIAVFMGAGMDAKAEDVVYYDSVKDVASVLREGMKEREAEIKIGYTTTEALDNSIINEIMEEALEHTGVPTEGDYLKGHYKSFKASAKGTSKNGVNNLVFTYTVKYSTDHAQEVATDQAAAKILSKLQLDGKDSYTKVREIYDYICQNVTYDWDHKEDDSYPIKHTAYAAAVNKTSVCQGYTLLFYRLCLASGVDVRVIEGTGNGEAHSWNIVKIDNQYYLIDATWDSSLKTYEYFLKGTDDFKDHNADKEFTDSSFTKEYAVADSHYVYSGEHDHEYLTTLTKATFSKAGKIEEKCWVCENEKEAKVIAKVNSAKLASTVYNYTGNARTPAVTVKDKNGKVLTQGTDYKLTYSTGRKNVGQYSVKITLKGNYSGNKTLNFKIRPEKTKINTLSAGAKNFTVKYNKITKQTTGYQIQYSTASDFNSAKSTLVTKNTTVSKKITGLKANKKYYVRVRTYKTVKIDGKSTKIYSAWSSVKNVKTK